MVVEFSPAFTDEIKHNPGKVFEVSVHVDAEADLMDVINTGFVYEDGKQFPSYTIFSGKANEAVLNRLKEIQGVQFIIPVFGTY
jgi:hypothetical protein